jgi:hypothetical protein
MEFIRRCNCPYCDWDNNWFAQLCELQYGSGYKGRHSYVVTISSTMNLHAVLLRVTNKTTRVLMAWGPLSKHITSPATALSEHNTTETTVMYIFCTHLKLADVHSALCKLMQRYVSKYYNMGNTDPICCYYSNNITATLNNSNKKSNVYTNTRAIFIFSAIFMYIISYHIISYHISFQITYLYRR